MKTSIAVILSVVACPVFSGGMGDVSSETNSTYVAVSGGYYGANYRSNYTSYDSGILSTQQSFNDTNTNGYGQLGLGASAQLGSLAFDHQISIAKLGGADKFAVGSSNWSHSQNVDFGYDFMPKLNLIQKISAYGILGAHYARFTNKSIPYASSTGLTEFNNYNDQIGFSLGAGLNYQVKSNIVVGIKYQHLQYQSFQINGANPALTSIDIQQIAPSYNLVGAELRYYIN